VAATARNAAIRKAVTVQGNDGVMYPTIPATGKNNIPGTYLAHFKEVRLFIMP
jgi:hypothetical protein